MAVRLPLLLGLMVATALPAAAQRTVEVQRDTGRRAFRVTINGKDMTETLAPLMQRRARLGVTVSLEARATDSVGAYLESVTPGGPAAKAGLQAGDIVTRLDGQSVLGGTTRHDEGQSVPGLRLIELAAKLGPGDTVTVNYVRSNARRTASLVTGDEPIAWADGDVMRLMVPGGERIFEFPGMRFQPRTEIELRPRIELERNSERWTPRELAGLPREPGAWTVFVGGGALASLELAPINPDLGSYFGTTEGILVVKVGENSPLGLKAGDVILSVDGRKPSSSSSLMRILRSYENGEPVRFEVMRQKRRETVTGKMETGGGMVHRMERPDGEF